MQVAENDSRDGEGRQLPMYGMLTVRTSNISYLVSRLAVPLVSDKQHLYQTTKLIQGCTFACKAVS
jgi:hypothetical protein